MSTVKALEGFQLFYEELIAVKPSSRLRRTRLATTSSK